MKKHSVAKSIGHAFAHLQNGVDRLFAFGFQKLRNSGQKKETKNMHPLKKSLRRTASFLGEVGAEFYSEYEKLKQKKK